MLLEATPRPVDVDRRRAAAWCSAASTPASTRWPPRSWTGRAGCRAPCSTPTPPSARVLHVHARRASRIEVDGAGARGGRPTPWWSRTPATTAPACTSRRTPRSTDGLLDVVVIGAALQAAADPRDAEAVRRLARRPRRRARAARPEVRVRSDAPSRRTATASASRRSRSPRRCAPGRCTSCAEAAQAPTERQLPDQQLGGVVAGAGGAGPPSPVTALRRPPRAARHPRGRPRRGPRTRAAAGRRAASRPRPVRAARRAGRPRRCGRAPRRRGRRTPEASGVRPRTVDGLARCRRTGRSPGSSGRSHICTKRVGPSRPGRVVALAVLDPAAGAEPLHLPAWTTPERPWESACTRLPSSTQVTISRSACGCRS